LQSQVYEEIEHVASEIADIEGVEAVVLFGSYARGDYAEGSDVDLLALFKRKTDLDKGSTEVYGITGKSALFFQVICMALEELESSTLLESVLRDGRILFSSKEARKSLTPVHKPYALVTYSTANLKAKQRVIFSQKLEGRRQNKYRYEGLIHRLGGYKVGKGVLMIPSGNLKALTEHFERTKIEYSIRYVWA
jgi:predicted nucleotidyltransferase